MSKLCLCDDWECRCWLSEFCGHKLCNPMDCSIPGSPVLHCLLEFVQNSYPLSQWCYLTISSSVAPFSSCPQSFPVSGTFPMSWLFTSGGQGIGASASASVLPRNIHGWSTLGLTGLISLQSKGLSRVFFNTTVWKHQFFSSQLSYSPTLTSIHDYNKNLFLGHLLGGCVVGLMATSSKRTYATRVPPRAAAAVYYCLFLP